MVKGRVQKNVIFVILSLIILTQEKSFAEKFDYGHEPAFALGLSVIGTALPVALGLKLANPTSNPEYTKVSTTLVLSGLFLGPSTGQFYANAPRHGFLGIGIRTAGAGVIILGFANLNLNPYSDAPPHPPNEKLWAAVSIIGAMTYVGGVFYSLYDSYAQGLVLQENRMQKQTFGVTPILQITPASAKALAEKSSLPSTLTTGAVGWMRY